MPFFHVATSLAATHVATSKMMSRPQAAPQSFQSCRNLKIPGCNTLKTNPGCDLKSKSRPQTVHPKLQHGFSCHDQGLHTPNLSQVATPKKGCRDTNSSSLCRDAKRMSRPRPVWPRLRARCPGRGCALALSCELRPPLPCAPVAFLSRPQH